MFFLMCISTAPFLFNANWMSSFWKQNLSIDTDLHAANGKRVKALDIFAYALAFFKEQALKVIHIYKHYSILSVTVEEKKPFLMNVQAKTPTS